MTKKLTVIVKGPLKATQLAPFDSTEKSSREMNQISDNVMAKLEAAAASPISTAWYRKDRKVNKKST